MFNLQGIWRSMFSDQRVKQETIINYNGRIHGFMISQFPLHIASMRGSIQSYSYQATYQNLNNT